MIQTVEKPAAAAAKPRRRWARILAVPALLGVIFAVQHFHNWTNDALIEAVMQGDADRAHFMLSLRADPNMRLNSLGMNEQPVTFWERLLASFGVRHTVRHIDRCRTALMLSSASNKTQIVRDLLAHGADPNIRMYNGATALSYCGAKVHPDIIVELLNHGASPNVRTTDGVSPFLQASFGGHVTSMRALLEHGANPHEQGPNGETPLMLAAMSHDDSAVRFLLDRGATLADIHAPPSEQSQVMAARSSAATYATTQSVPPGRPVSPPAGNSGAGDVYGDRAIFLMAARSPLLFAATTGSNALLQLAWDNAAESERKGTAGIEALVAAIDRGHREMAIDLIRRGARFKPESPGEPDPLFSSIVKGNVELVQWLLSHGVDPNASGPRSRPAVMAVASMTPAAAANMLGILMSHGADINAADPDSGETVVFMAANSVPLLTVLISRGAKVEVRDRSGRTPLLSCFDLKATKVLLDHGADPNVADSTGMTPLMHSIQQHQLEMVRLLLSHRANPNATDRFGNCPLRMAQNWAEGTAELKKAGAKDPGTPTNVLPANALRPLGNAGSRPVVVPNGSQNTGRR